MQFVQLQDEVIAARFRAAQRESVKKWINWRYNWVNAIADWPWMAPFTEIITFDPFTANYLDADVIRVYNVHDVDNDNELTYLNLVDYRRRYSDADTGTTPETYTLNSNQSTTEIILGPPDASTGSLQILTTARPPTLDGDTQEPVWPTPYHFILVLGATSTGLKLENDPTWEALETEFLAAIEVMKAEILPPLQPEPRQYGREISESWL